MTETEAKRLALLQNDEKYVPGKEVGFTNGQGITVETGRH